MNRFNKTTRQPHHLALKGARHDTLAQVLEAVHLGLHQAAPVVAAPDLVDGSPKAFACPHRFVSVGRAKSGSHPKIGVLARWIPGLRASLGNHIKTVSRVIYAIRTDAGDGVSVHPLSGLPKQQSDPPPARPQAFVWWRWMWMCLGTRLGGRHWPHQLRTASWTKS